ncbi:MAG: heme ABC transporter ATP-binding protein [Leptospiraceae bacterium]|nr:heme ABC transporter ATP-binding protein [Leptospiraceae bacterium]
MIQAHNLTYYYNSNRILNNIDLDLHPGQLVSLLGRNGEGKSTLFKILTGDYRAQNGEVLYNGVNVLGMNRKELARIRSVLPQDSTINFPLRVFEIIEMGRAPYGKNHSNLTHYANRSMELTDIKHLRNRFYSDLSGGEKQRVQIARALCQLDKEPVLLEKNRSNDSNLCSLKGYLFLDEPVNSLDILLQHKIMKILRHLADVGFMVFCILHDWNLAGLYSDRILILQNGQLVHNGLPQEVLDQNNLESNFNILANVYPHGNKFVGGYTRGLSKR